MHVRLLFSIVGFSVLTACGRGSPKPDAPVTLSSAEVPTDPAENGRARLRALEGNLEYGRAWGSDASAKAAAVAILSGLVREAWLEQGDIAVAVEILPYQPRRVITLVKLKYLTDQKSDRRVYVDTIKTALEEQALKNDDFTIGVRDTVSYGAIATGRHDGTAWEVRLNSGVSVDPLERALATSK